MITCWNVNECIHVVWTPYTNKRIKFLFFLKKEKNKSEKCCRNDKINHIDHINREREVRGDYGIYHSTYIAIHLTDRLFQKCVLKTVVDEVVWNHAVATTVFDIYVFLHLDQLLSMLGRKIFYAKRVKGKDLAILIICLRSRGGGLHHELYIMGAYLLNPLLIQSQNTPLT